MFHHNRSTAIILILGMLSVTACGGKGASTTGSENSSYATAVARSPEPLYTGPATLERQTAALVGHQLSATTFLTCAHAIIQLEQSDKLRPGGSCSVNYDIVALQAQKGLAGRGLVGATVNASAQQGDTAIATFVKGRQAGQILLVRGPNGTWQPVTISAEKIQPKDGALFGASAATVKDLQGRLPFDIHAPAVSAIRP